MSFNRKTKLRDNIEAIRTVLLLEKENRKATPHEKEILQRYCGFGGLKCILNPASGLSVRCSGKSLIWNYNTLHFSTTGDVFKFNPMMHIHTSHMVFFYPDSGEFFDYCNSSGTTSDL